MKLTDVYWKKTRRLTLVLLVIWVFITFVLSWFSPWLNQWQFLSFPLGFYMAAQGSLLIFLLLIWIYNRRMHQLDAEYGIDDE
jgi:putative solute:sodium symporter small subunit